MIRPRGIPQPYRGLQQASPVYDAMRRGTDLYGHNPMDQRRQSQRLAALMAQAMVRR